MLAIPLRQRLKDFWGSLARQPKCLTSELWANKRSHLKIKQLAFLWTDIQGCPLTSIGTWMHMHKNPNVLKAVKTHTHTRQTKCK